MSQDISQESNQHSNISTADILNVAKLSRLAISEETANDYAKDISKILMMMDTLSEVNTDEVLPLSNVHDAYQVLRDDIADFNIDRELNQSNAPSKQDGLFQVPKVVE